MSRLVQAAVRMVRAASSGVELISQAGSPVRRIEEGESTLDQQIWLEQM